MDTYPSALSVNTIVVFGIKKMQPIGAAFFSFIDSVNKV